MCDHEFDLDLKPNSISVLDIGGLIRNTKHRRTAVLNGVGVHTHVADITSVDVKVTTSTQWHKVTSSHIQK